jgi:hypothetical protein
VESVKEHFVLRCLVHLYPLLAQGREVHPVTKHNEQLHAIVPLLPVRETILLPVVLYECET